MIKFASTHKETPGTIVMITSNFKAVSHSWMHRSYKFYSHSGDEGFREQISDLRYKHGHKVILIHGHNVNPQFLKFPNEYYNFYDLMDELPDMNISVRQILEGKLGPKIESQSLYLD